MVELPGLSRRHQGVEAGNLISEHCYERGPRGNGVARNAEVLPPRFDRVGRVAPIRLCLEREGGKSLCFVFLRWADVHLATFRAWPLKITAIPDDRAPLPRDIQAHSRQPVVWP